MSAVLQEKTGSCKQYSMWVFFDLIILRVISGVKEIVEFFLSISKKQSIPNKLNQN